MSDALDPWTSIPNLIHAAIAGRSPAELDHRAAPEQMSLRELTHHLVEANVVAASIVIAALGSPGCTYDWSWMLPFGAWLDRMQYRIKPVEPALALLDALNAYVAAQVRPLPDGLEREVCLRDSPGAVLRRVTVAEVLQQEVDHVCEHLGLQVGTSAG